MADTGPDAIETLTSNRSSGDVDLADAKQRIGDRVCLFGGFNEHLLHEAGRRRRPRGGQALPRRGDGGRRLRAALDRPALRRQARPDRGRVRDRARPRPRRGRSGYNMTDDDASSTSRPRPTARRRAAADAGVPPRQPLRRRVRPDPERRHGLGRPKVGRDQFLILSHPGRPAGRRRHADRARLPHRPLGGRPAGARGGARARPPGRAAVRRTSPTRATAARRARPGCSTPCPTATTPRSCSAGSSARCRRRRGVIGVATCDKGLPAMMMALAPRSATSPA